MDENKLHSTEGCSAMKPDGAGVPFLVFETKEEYEAFRNRPKLHNKEYYLKRGALIKEGNYVSKNK